MAYDIHLHQHRFAAWAAARASSVKGRRFSVQTCVGWVEAVGLDSKLTKEKLPHPKELLEWHRRLREAIIAAAKEQSNFELSHGQAAKIINCYVKARFLNESDAQHINVAAFHPPIDRLLLSDIVRNACISVPDLKIIRGGRDGGWSNLSSENYERLIEALQRISPQQPFWHIERYWCGFQ